MSDLTIIALCQVLANLTHNRCHLLENSNTCRCVDNIIDPKPTTVVSTAPDIMLSEVLLIFFVLILWLSAIGFCLNQYKSLRRLETQVHYCVNRKDPLNIGDIKIVTREQDSIIYKKKRYSTAPDPNVNREELKTMQYVKEYLPKNITTSSTVTTGVLVVSRENITTNIPVSTTTISLYNPSGSLTQTPYIPLSTHNELAEEQQSQSPSPSLLESNVLLETDTNKPIDCMSYINRTESGRLSTGLTVPYISTPNSLPSSWNGSQMHETSFSTQHLCVPSNSLRSNRYSDGNISLTVPQILQKNSENPDEQLLDPRLISRTVRRSLLALHRESHENIHMHRTKEKTQSENDVHIAFIPWKIKMKSKLKRTHHRNYPQQQQQLIRPHSNTVSILPIQQNSNDQERRISDYARMNHEYRFSTPPSRNCPLTTTLPFRRSLRHYPKYTTQSTTESETTQNDLPMITSIDVSVNNDEATKTIVQTDTPYQLSSL
ncbi:unnamed protein product [Rotaria sp. Silwood1]|nr:unnamed protein product [Rotaria sp. Silwood1]CAF3460089.1 unnamed protein product [Rotaria sp. Silwood1]CAF3497970.1 unnamed protein product [Rotaria sp. Silwood1]CAF3501448.1 unnamed protein product [Rotaria sp. Silwood1]CAF4510869.1 unnamed protein product [Rotaria sp. Silwood1]